jgi:hypothetical protein
MCIDRLSFIDDFVNDLLSQSDVIINLAISRDNLLLQRANVPALAFQLIKLSKLLLLLLVEVVKVGVHGASETGAGHLLVKIWLANDLLNHTITLLLSNQVLLVPHHVAAFEQLHE